MDIDDDDNDDDDGKYFGSGTKLICPGESITSSYAYMRCVPPTLYALVTDHDILCGWNYRLQMRQFFEEGEFLVAGVQTFLTEGMMSLHTRSLTYGLLPSRFRPLPLPRRHRNTSSARQIRPKIYHRDGGSLYFRVTPIFSRKSSFEFSLPSGLIRARSARRERSVCPVLFCNGFLVGPYLILTMSFLCVNGLACMGHDFQQMCGLHFSTATGDWVVWACNYSNIVYNTSYTVSVL